MPAIDVFVPQGLLPAGSERPLARALTEALLKLLLHLHLKGAGPEWGVAAVSSRLLLSLLCCL